MRTPIATLNPRLHQLAQQQRELVDDAVLGCPAPHGVDPRVLVGGARTITYAIQQAELGRVLRDDEVEAAKLAVALLLLALAHDAQAKRGV